MKAEYARVEDLPAFQRVAEALAARLQPGEVVALSGELGAGKTTFVRSVVRALHGADQAFSPTFTFRHRYTGEPPVEHLDLYRIQSPAEAVELGLEEAFDGTSIVMVEWPEHLPHLIPEHAIHVAISGAGDAPRDIVIERR
jgi:tRNA threonylcarbamoyladenosine biosynthesis protein TsaE